MRSPRIESMASSYIGTMGSYSVMSLGIVGWGW
jgi:hypothetical protein